LIDVRQLLPGSGDVVDPFDAYRDTPAQWLRLNFVASVDGSVTEEHGRSGDLGGDADQHIFRVLRTLADAILVGANTLRKENYGPHRPTAHSRERRAALGKPAQAPIVVVSRSLDLDPGHRFFTEAARPPLVVTSAAAAAAAVPALRPYLLVAGETEVDFAAALRRLRGEYGLAHVLCEGGPHLATQLIAAGLVDELCLTVAPTLIGLGHRTGLLDQLPGRIEVTLTALYEQDGVLFTRYRTGTP
jgi:5-amino-6-(5-phosphoribosylamino)uracil reductase